MLALALLSKTRLAISLPSRKAPSGSPCPFTHRALTFCGGLPWGAAGAMGKGRQGPPGVRALGHAWQGCRGAPGGPTGRPRALRARGPRGVPRPPAQFLAAGQLLGLPWGAAGAMDICKM